MFEGFELFGYLASKDFLAGMVVEFLGGLGYDLTKSGTGSFSDRLARLWSAGSGFKNHDLMRALRYAECEAMVAVCSTCLLEDYGTERSLLHAFVNGPDPWPHLTDPEVRQIAAIRSLYRKLADRVPHMDLAELASQTAAQLDDVESLVRSTREIVPRQSAGALRDRMTKTVCDNLRANFRPDRITEIQMAVGTMLGEPPKLDTTALIPEKLWRRIETNWFDLARLAFRETLKDPKFAKARSAFDLDILSKLSDSPGLNLAAIEKLFDQQDERLDEMSHTLKDIYALVNAAPVQGKGNLNARFAAQQQQFHKNFVAYQTEVLQRLDTIGATTTRVETKQDRLGTKLSALHRLMLLLLAVIVIGGSLLYYSTRPKPEPVKPKAPPPVMKVLVNDAQGRPVAGAVVELDALPGKQFITDSKGAVPIENIPRQKGDLIQVKVSKGNAKGGDNLTFPNAKSDPITLPER